MLIQLLIQHPQALGSVLHKTPVWVWGLLAALLALGLSQVRTRSISALRMALMPAAMAGLSLWGTASAFGSSPLFAYVLLAWAVCAALMLGLMAPLAPPAGTVYDATSRRFHMPGSWVPLALILGIFLTKYIVGIELSMQPTLARDGQYTLIVGSLYGLFSGIFAGRAVRLWRLARRPGGRPAATAFNT
ncbi:DUF6622 family protein [Polaromonas sp. SM01]|uniref:DUF6622 family protein n=1 Tax=Polaromonas sp. SM01 TaxID=3085630 RepID=UPI0029817A3B|nr:DUF6622 family protein [Polaromonas sp. SM01]MDW5443367.1 DUF6622 family protein [Polaromonas sp. SM01]